MMTHMQLHEDQLDIADDALRSAIDAQFPQWSDLALHRLVTDGTINRIDMLGDEFVVRTPFIEWGATDIASEAGIVPRLGSLPVETPELVARGTPAPGIPFEWGVYRRLHGRHPRLGDDADAAAVADGLVQVITALRAIPPQGPPSAAVFHFADDDAHTRGKVAELSRWMDVSLATAAWDAAVAAHPWDGKGTWIHGDLVSGNLLLRDDPTPRLAAILDWPAAGIGDPAFDLLPAWTSLTRPDRERFLEALDATPDQVARGRGYALRKVAWGLPYYEHSLPGFAAMLAHAASEISAELAAR